MYYLTLAVTVLTSLAALFAFLSWRASSINRTHERERLLRDKFRGLFYPLDENHNLEPITFQVSEKRGWRYHFYRYVLFRQFEGTTKVYFKCSPNVLNEDIIKTLDDQSYFDDLGIRDNRIDKDDYSKFELEFNTADIKELSERFGALQSALKKYSTVVE